MNTVRPPELAELWRGRAGGNGLLESQGDRDIFVEDQGLHSCDSPCP